MEDLNDLFLLGYRAQETCAQIARRDLAANNGRGTDLLISYSFFSSPDPPQALPIAWK
jgi:hypothetical protein